MLELEEVDQQDTGSPYERELFVYLHIKEVLLYGNIDIYMAFPQCEFSCGAEAQISVSMTFHTVQT